MIMEKREEMIANTAIAFCSVLSEVDELLSKYHMKIYIPEGLYFREDNDGLISARLSIVQIKPPENESNPASRD
jgi:hypothetical protein